MLYLLFQWISYVTGLATTCLEIIQHNQRIDITCQTIYVEGVAQTEKSRYPASRLRLVRFSFNIIYFTSITQKFHRNNSRNLEDVDRGILWSYVVEET